MTHAVSWQIWREDGVERLSVAAPRRGVSVFGSAFNSKSVTRLMRRICTVRSDVRKERVSILQIVSHNTFMLRI